MPRRLGSLRVASRTVAAALGVLAVAGLGVNVGETIFDWGGRATSREIVDSTYQLLIVGAALAALLRGALVPLQRGAWLCVGAGLGAWALGELGWVGTPDSALLTYSWVSHVAFFIFYVGVLAGLRLLAGRTQDARALSVGFLVGLLGVATLWAGIFFGPGDGQSFELAADFAYPFLDVVVVAVILGVWATYGWRRDSSLALLLVGFALITVADTTYAIQVHEDTYVARTLLDTLWPIGAVMIAWAAWVSGERGRAVDLSSEWLSLWVTITAGCLAVVVLVWDHFERMAFAAVLIAALTLLVALGHAALLQGRWSRAHWRGARAAELSSQALATIVEMQSGRSSNSLQRRTELAELLGTELQLRQGAIEELRVATRLANVGRLTAPGAPAQESLKRPLSGPERARRDAARAAQLLEAIGLAGASAHIRDQHERWDERTENGARRDELSLESGILAVVNEVDALTGKHDKGEGMSYERACAEIAAQAGARFDPRVVDALIRILPRLR
jgi:hypothetical protein